MCNWTKTSIGASTATTGGPLSTYARSSSPSPCCGRGPEGASGVILHTSRSHDMYHPARVFARKGQMISRGGERGQQPCPSPRLITYQPLDCMSQLRGLGLDFTQRSTFVLVQLDELTVSRQLGSYPRTFFSKNYMYRCTGINMRQV